MTLKISSRFGELSKKAAAKSNASHAGTALQQRTPISTAELKRKVLGVLTNANSLKVSGSDFAALESFNTERVPELVAGSLSDDAALECALACGVPNSQAAAVATSLMNVVQGKNSSLGGHFGRGRNEYSGEMIQMGQIVGSGALEEVNSGWAALEAFGVGANTVAADARLNAFLTVMRPASNYLDRVVPRIPEEQNTVVVKIPRNEIFDTAAAQNVDAAVRNGAHRKTFLSLHRDPSPVDTTPKQIVLRTENDSNNLLYPGASQFIKVGVEANLKDLARNAADPTLSVTNFTDLVAEGALIKNALVKVTKTDGGTTEELFLVPFERLPTSRFMAPMNQNDSQDRVALTSYIFVVRPGSKQSNGTTSAIFGAGYTGAAVSAKVTISGNLNHQTAYVQINGNVTGRKVAMNDGTAVPGGLTTEYNKITNIEVVAVELDARWSEANVRKTTIGVVLRNKQQAFEIPPGRNVLVEYELAQGDDMDVPTAMASALAMGNAGRGLAIIKSKLRDIAAHVQWAVENPDYAAQFPIENTTLAGSLCIPYSKIETIDFSDIANMRESERAADVAKRVADRIQSMAAEISQKSLYQTNFVNGERMVLKAITSTYLAKILFGVHQYHNVLNEQQQLKAGADNVDFSYFLADGTRVDVIGINQKNAEGEIVFFPIREADPNHVTSAVHTHDRGTFVGSYTNTEAGAATRRVLGNARELVFPSNPIGGIIEIVNLDMQYGSSAEGN